MEERARMLKLRMGNAPNYSAASGSSSGSRSWRSQYSGHSDNDLPPPPRQSSLRGTVPPGHSHHKPTSHSSGRSHMRSSGGKILSPDRETGPGGTGGGSVGGGGGDSDVESMVSSVSGTSALSTQSERPSAYSRRTG